MMMSVVVEAVDRNGAKGGGLGRKLLRLLWFIPMVPVVKCNNKYTLTGSIGCLRQSIDAVA